MVFAVGRTLMSEGTYGVTSLDASFAPFVYAPSVPVCIERRRRYGERREGDVCVACVSARRQTRTKGVEA